MSSDSFGAIRLGMIWTLPGGTEASDEYAIVITVEDGLVRRQESLVDWVAALAALTGARSANPPKRV